MRILEKIDQDNMGCRLSIYIIYIEHNMKGQNLKLFSDYELARDTPYLALTGELYGASFPSSLEKRYCKILRVYCIGKTMNLGGKEFELETGRSTTQEIPLAFRVGNISDVI